MTPGPSSGRGDDAPPRRALPFVGRETPLAALVSAVQAAELGERVLALVAGEPGIGKTRLVREAVTRVSSHVLWATCWNGEGAPAYWPWSQLLRALPAGGADETDGSGDGEGTGPHRGTAQLGVLLGDAPAPEVSVGARLRLFDAVAEALAEASRRRPLVVVIEDLHWADEASVRLLELVAHDSRPRRLAIIGTYRQADVSAGSPLANRLGELIRDGVHLSLGGLGRRDVETLVDSVTGESVDVAGLVPLLHRKSGGNPFFLEELLRHVDAEGSLGATGDDGATPVPDGVRAVVARRLGTLSAATREVLAGAAVIGVEFDPLVLGPTTGRAGEDLLTALDEAVTAGLVTSTGDQGAFAFAHAVVREVLYEGLGLAERAAAHRRVAEEIERRYGDARLAELAHHVLRGAGPGGDERAVDVAVRAAERSVAGLAYEEAAAWYARALGALRSGSRDDRREADLLLRHGEAHFWAGDLPAARCAYEHAAAIARAGHDAELLARAALGLGAGFGGFEVQLLDPVQIELLEEALGALDPGPSSLRALVLARLSVALSFIGDDTRRGDLSKEAVATARTVGDPAVLGYALAGHCDAIAGPDHCETRLEESSEVVRLARHVADRQLELLGRRLRLVALLETGDAVEADAEIERFALVADRLRQPLYQWYVPLWRGMRALMRGDLEEAARRRAEAQELGAKAHSDNAFALTFTQWWIQERYEDRWMEAGQAMAEVLGGDHSGPPITVGPRAIAALQAGDIAKARILLEQWVEAGLHERVQDSEWLPEAAQKAEAAVVADARSVAETLYRQLRPYGHRSCVEGIGAAFTGSVAWYLSLLARFLGHDEEAASYEAQARAAHRRAGLVGDPPPLASPPPPAPVSAGALLPSTSRPAGTASLVLEGANWAATYAGATQRLRDSKGLRDLAVLLARHGEEVHCLELVGGADVGSEAGPVLDQQARRAYEGRIRDLQADIDEARAGNDLGRAERAEAELDALVQQLSEAFGLSGRSRSTGSAAERARSAVGWRIRAALRHTAEVHPELGRHLQNSVRTGTWCSYRPEVPVAWEIDDARRPSVVTVEPQGRRA